MLHIFRLGEAYDDLTPMFAVDGRDYPDDESVRADLRSAMRTLTERHFIADFVSSEITPGTPAPNFPSWPRWRARHIDGDEPIGVRPRPRTQSIPPGWEAMGRWLSQAQQWITARLVAASAAVPGARVRAIGQPEPRRVGPASVVLAEERYRVEVVFLVIPPAASTCRDVLDRLAGWLRGNHWSVAPLEESPTAAVLIARSSGYTISAVWSHRDASVRLTGASATVDATQFEAGKAPAGPHTRDGS
jgi:hypothetical protein